MFLIAVKGVKYIAIAIKASISNPTNSIFIIFDHLKFPISVPPFPRLYQKQISNSITISLQIQEVHMQHSAPINQTIYGIFFPANKPHQSNPPPNYSKDKPT